MLGPWLFIGGVLLSITGSKLLAKRRTQKQLDACARRLGLGRAGPDLYGSYRGLLFGARPTFNSGGGRAARWTIQARIQPPLDLGISIRTRRGAIRDDTAGAIGVYTGDRSFDHRYDVFADEVPRALALCSPALRAALLSELPPHVRVLLNDHGLAVNVLHDIDPRWLAQSFETMSRVVFLVKQQCNRVPAASSLSSHQHHWKRFARNWGIHSSTTPLSLWGEFEGASIRAHAVRLSAGRHCLEIWLHFDQPLGLGLSVQPVDMVERVKALFGHTNHRFDDPPFDESFVVRVHDAEGVARLLDSAIRAELLRLQQQVGPLSVSDDGVSVRLDEVPLDPKIVPRTVHQLLGIAKTLAEKRRSTRGPYR